MNQTPIFEIKNDEVRTDYGRFVIEPLEQGYGHTLGSSLRRVLLNSLPGAAVTEVKIAGLKHQFSSIKGVKEDGVDLLLNIKQVRVSYAGDKPVKLTLSAKGKGVVLAGDIKTPSGVKIANPDLVIANLMDKTSKLDVEMQAEAGVGYSTSEDRKTGTVGTIPVDADFSPISRVAYKIEETRVGRLTNFDKLILDIWTDATIDPETALKRSAEILTSYFTHIVLPVKAGGKRESKPKKDAKLANISVEELNLPTRVTNALVNAGFETVADLVRGKGELAKVRNLGEKSVKIIDVALGEKDISWE